MPKIYVERFVGVTLTCAHRGCDEGDRRPAQRVFNADNDEALTALVKAWHWSWAGHRAFCPRHT